MSSFVARQWQTEMLETFDKWVDERQAGDSRTFVAAVAGAAGKTHGTAMILWKHDVEGRVIVVVPNQTIAEQWVATLSSLGYFPPTIWDGGDYSRQPLVTTYNMMALYPKKLRDLYMVSKKSIIVFDECHHLADSAAWGEAARTIANKALYRVMLTATPFREDEMQIPFVTYREKVLQTNYQYSYGDALRDGYVRPIQFHCYSAEGWWQQDDKMHIGRFDNRDAQKVLNACVEPNSKALRQVIKDAHASLEATRVSYANAGGIIACRNQDDARKIQRLVQRVTKTNPILAISDEADSDAKIAEFRESDSHWLVVVRKGFEGMDAPRISEIVHASNVTTGLFFQQLMYRGARDTGDKRVCNMRFFGHPKLIDHAQSIRDMRVHVLGEVPEVEAQSTEKRKEATATDYVAAEMTDVERFGFDVPESGIGMLREVAHMAMHAIGLAAELGDTSQVAPTIEQLRRLLGVRVAEDVPVLAPQLAEYEAKRQRARICEVFDAVQAMPRWYRDMLSILWSNRGRSKSPEWMARMLGDVVTIDTLKSKSKNRLIALGLVRYSDGALSLNEHYLLDVAPDLDLSAMMTALVTGEPLPSYDDEWSKFFVGAL